MNSSERDQLKWSFDANAAVYDRGRPGYPDRLFDDVIALARLPPGGRILEIGPGTGHATLPFAARGYQIESIELGRALADRWRQNLADYPIATITVGQFEDIEVSPATYDLAIAASSFHWIDPKISYTRVARTLKPGGAIALWWNRSVLLPGDDRYAELAAPIFRRFAPELLNEEVNLPTADAVPAPAAARIAVSGLFGPVAERRYRWSRTVESREFLDWLGSFSRYSMMEPDRRSQLFGELCTQIDEHLGGAVTRGIVTLLYVASRSE
ncbi:class I SAM-dependent methyltransferase [soil metagenome]